MKITSPLIRPRSVTRPKSENEGYSALEKSPTKLAAKSRIHKSVKSLIDQESSKIDKDLIDDLRNFSNSFNCLDATKI